MIENNELVTLQQQLETQLVMVKEMQGIKEDMVTMRDEVKQDVQELRDSITLTRSEGGAIQSLVGTKAWQLTDELFGKPVSDDLFLAKHGHFRGIIYKRLKDTFNVPRYYDIRRVDFVNAQKVIEMVSLNNLQPYQLRLTARQMEIAEMNGDDIA
ncbi:ORF6C domain-containing protein [Vagococcus vulneris]|uniref:ORF6C domain-containing protein n=1 Tax=Vagococcus vulneris TaxID=1977869 RepID=A0A429ZQT0_9ENTE|nr:ORF6C domain-containing protein [Vagococcus vulneris]RST96025.1 hypothetical protein CBF37_11310 [Vagococcus vulneris]